MEHACFIHCRSDLKASERVELNGISERKWKTIVESAKRWVNIDSEEKEIAKKVLSFNLKPEVDDRSIQSVAQCHTQCYQRFTNNRRIEQGESRHEKCTEGPSSAQESCSSRSKRGQQSNSGASEEKRHVLPRVCLVCRAEKWTQDKAKGTWKLEPLCQVSRPNAFLNQMCKLLFLQCNCTVVGLS